MALTDAVGRALGWLMVPGFVAGTKLRRARVFHPSGTVWRGVAEALSPAGEALAGPVLARIGGAAWKHEREWPDVLGVAFRFGESPTVHVDGEVDLLLATFRTPFHLPAAFVTTDPHDFLANTYWASVPYRVGGREGNVRAVPAGPSPPGEHRIDRLAAAVAAGTASFRLEADGVPFARVRLTERVELDQRPLRFAPFAGGRGIEPTGLLTAMRSIVYPKSQDARGA